MVHNFIDDSHDLLILHHGLVRSLHGDVLVLLVRGELAPRLQASLLCPLYQVELGLGDPEPDAILLILKIIELS